MYYYNYFSIPGAGNWTRFAVFFLPRDVHQLTLSCTVPPSLLKEPYHEMVIFKFVQKIVIYAFPFAKLLQSVFLVFDSRQNVVKR